jgi:hypothetical protein
MPTILSLNNKVDNLDGDTTKLINTAADDKAVDVVAWIDARTWLLSCPHRLIQIARKRLNGISLDHKAKEHLRRFRQREQKRLFEPCIFSHS